MFKTIDKYILKEMIPFFLVGFSFFNLIFIINRLLEMMDMLIVKRVEGIIILKLLVTMLPFTFAITVPLSVLVAVLMAFGRLSSESEVIALLSGGTSYTRMLRMPIVAGIVMSLLMVAFNNWVLPVGNSIFKKTYIEVQARKPFSQLQEHRFTKIGTRTIGVDRIDERNNILENIIMYDDNASGAMTITSARRGTWLKNEKVQDKFGIPYQYMRLELSDGIVQTYERFAATTTEPEFQVQTFRKMVIVIKFRLLDDFGVEKSAREMTIPELSKEIVRLEKQKDTYTLRRMLVEFHKKFSIPFASLAFVLFGIPLVMTRKKTGVGFGLGISLIVMIVYYIFLTVGETFGKNGTMNPFVAMWIANIILSLAGAGILWRISK